MVACASPHGINDLRHCFSKPENWFACGLIANPPTLSHNLVPCVAELLAVRTKQESSFPEYPHLGG